MSDFFSLESLRTHSGGVFRARPEHAPLASGLSFDTRSLRPGQVFLALRGERADGHAFLRRAFEAGAPVAIVEAGSSIDPPEGMVVIEVASCRDAIVRLASAYRRTLSSTRVIAVTGSNGKTTTVRLIDHVLGSAMRGRASEKSHNNRLGLPLTILNAARSDQYLVLECGTSGPGEIRALGAIARPDIAVITSIGRAHLEGLGSREGIAREKAGLLLELAPGGLGVVTADAPELGPFMPEGAACLRFGVSDDAALRVSEVKASSEGVRFTINGRSRFAVPLLGAHNATNAAAAIGVARRLGMDDAAIAAALARARGPEMRLDRRTIAGVDVINDAYNANPESVLAAVASFGALTPGASRRVLVLGEMRELGPDSDALHEEVGRAVARSVLAGDGPEVVVLVGPLAEPAAGPIRGVLGPGAVLLEGEAGDGRSIAGRLHPGDAVLLKGSRAVGLERVAEALASAPGRVQA
jgi:UDP-N-acetylmuramoyl-tripeptide--D-alanyl-D-alanine ligase